MTTNNGYGRTVADVLKDFQARNEFGRVVESPVVNTVSQPVENNDAKVQKHLTNLRAQRTIALLVASFAGILSVCVAGTIIDNIVDLPDSPSEAVLEVVLYK